MLLFDGDMDGELHGSIRSCSFSRHNAVLKQTTRIPCVYPLVSSDAAQCAPRAPRLALLPLPALGLGAVSSVSRGRGSRRTRATRPARTDPRPHRRSAARHATGTRPCARHPIRHGPGHAMADMPMAMAGAAHTRDDDTGAARLVTASQRSSLSRFVNAPASRKINRSWPLRTQFPTLLFLPLYFWRAYPTHRTYTSIHMSAGI